MRLFFVFTFYIHKKFITLQKNKYIIDMKKIGFLGLVLAVFMVLVSCEEEVIIEDNPIPNSGQYFKMKLGDNLVWRGDYFPTMYVKTEPEDDTNRFIDFIVSTQDISDSKVEILDKYLVLHVMVNSDGSFSNYNLQYYEDRTLTAYPISFSKAMFYKSGELKIIENNGDIISGRFVGQMVDVYDRDDIRDVEIDFQEFNSSPAKKSIYIFKNKTIL